MFYMTTWANSSDAELYEFSEFQDWVIKVTANKKRSTAPLVQVIPKKKEQNLKYSVTLI